MRNWSKQLLRGFVWILGYITTQNCLFQKDLLRRHSAGRLAERFGEALVSSNQNQRILGFSGMAKEIVNNPSDSHTLTFKAAKDFPGSKHITYVGLSTKYEFLNM